MICARGYGHPSQDPRAPAGLETCFSGASREDACALQNVSKLVEKNYQEGLFLLSTVARTEFCYLSLQRIFIHYIADFAGAQVPATLSPALGATLVCGDLLRITKRLRSRKGLLSAKRIENSQIGHIRLSSCTFEG